MNLFLLSTDVSIESVCCADLLYILTLVQPARDLGNYILLELKLKQPKLLFLD